MEHSYLVQKALEYILEEMKIHISKDFTSLCDEAGARFNLSPLEVASLNRIFYEEYHNKR